MFHQTNKFSFSFFKVINRSFHFRCFLVLAASALLLSCDKPKSDSPNLPPAKEAAVDETGPTSTGNEQDGVEEKKETKPLAYGVEARELDSSSELYKKIAGNIRTLEGAEEHEIQFMVELEEGGFEVMTRVKGESYGWSIFVKVDEKGAVEIVKKGVWRA